MPPAVSEKLRDQFCQLKQLNTPVAEFEALFTSLSRFAPELVATEDRRCLECEKKLRTELMFRVTGSMIREYWHLVQAAAHLETIMQADEERIRGSKRSQEDKRDGKRQRGSNSQ